MYLAAFRTHLWDPEIRRMADIFAGNAPGARFVVAADETRGPLDTGTFETLSHTADFSALGLPEYPQGRSLWYNGDYPLYALEDAYPDHDYYVMSEFDVAVNTDVDELIERIAKRDLDLVAHDIRPAGEDWFWYRNARANYPEPYRSLIFFLVVSKRALRALRAARAAGAARTPTPDETWPFCETFVPSVIAAEGMRFAELAEFVATDNLRFRPHLCATDDRTRSWGSIAHPVLGRSRFAAAVLAEHDPATWFDEDSDLRRILAGAPLADIVGPLRDRLLARRDHVSLSRLRRECGRHGVPFEVPGADPDDLAVCRPARTSSVSSFSFAQDTFIDAAGANRPVLEPDHGFHTAAESEPWWMVDLEDEYVIDRVEIVNRPQLKERFRRFVIESARDGATWQARAWKFSDEDVSSDETAPWTQVFADPFVARHIRIRALETTTLHLRGVRVRGRRIL